MDSSQNKTDQAFEEKLRKRFENFEAPEKAELTEKILGIFPAKRRFRGLIILSTIFLLLCGLLIGYRYESSAIRGQNPVSKQLSAKPTSVQPSEARHGYPKKGTEETRFHTKSAQANDLVSTTKTNGSVVVIQKRKVEPASFDFVVPETIAASQNPAVTIEGSQEMAVDNILPIGELHFDALELPGISVPGFSKPEENTKQRNSSPFVPVFGITGLQQFQLLNIHSDSELPFQNIRFAPVLSTRSTGYKISAGVDKGPLRLLLNYGYLRNWTYYEIGSNRVEVSPSADGQYTLRRGGIPHLIDERLHLWGISARTALPMRHTPLKGFATLVGAEFTTVLPERTSMLWVNISSTKNLSLGKKIGLSVGPFAECSLTQRTLLDGRWQSRPYRVGLTAELRFLPRN